MTTQALLASVIAAAGVACLATAVSYERRMHRHRQPGISYAEATLRKDGGWRRSDLFTPVGLQLQRKASLWGVTGGVLLLASIAAWTVLGAR